MTVMFDGPYDSVAHSLKLVTPESCKTYAAGKNLVKTIGNTTVTDVCSVTGETLFSARVRNLFMAKGHTRYCGLFHGPHVHK
jgi:hypothetical protein